MQILHDIRMKGKSKGTFKAWDLYCKYQTWDPEEPKGEKAASMQVVRNEGHRKLEHPTSKGYLTIDCFQKSAVSSFVLTTNKCTSNKVKAMWEILGSLHYTEHFKLFRFNSFLTSFQQILMF